MSERLCQTRRVRAVLEQGGAVRGAHVVVRCLGRGDDGPSRWTVSASRRVGSAVRRNRAKRRLRAVMRQTELPVGTDVVVIARSTAVRCPFDELHAETGALIARSGTPPKTRTR